MTRSKNIDCCCTLGVLGAFEIDTSESSLVEEVFLTGAIVGVVEGLYGRQA